MTGCFDNTCRIWSCRDWSMIKELTGHESKVAHIDIAPNSQFLISCGYDRTWKIWHD